MNIKKIFSYKILAWISLFPILGGIVAWVASWLKLYKATGTKKYIFLSYLVLCAYSIVIAIPFALCISALADKNNGVKIAVGLPFAYTFMLGLGLVMVFFSYRMEKRYDARIISE